MHWDDLRFFLAVARTGQLGRAAITLEVDATTVGRRIRRLEASVQQSLFEQRREGQLLTEAGRKLLEQVEQIDRSASAITAAPPGAPLSGRIRVSVSEGFGTWIVAPELAGFLASHPGIEVDLVATNGFLNPSRRETDVAILLDRPRSGPLIAKKLANYALRLYAARSYLDAHAEPLLRDELRAHPLIGYIPDFIYAPELRYLDEIMPGLGLTIRSSSINAQHRLTAAGTGIAVLPSFIGDADPGLVNILPDVVIRRAFWLVTHEDGRRLARIDAFVEWLSKVVARTEQRLLGGIAGASQNDRAK